MSTENPDRDKPEAPLPKHIKPRFLPRVGSAGYYIMLALVALLIVFPNFILLLIVFFGALETWRRWKARKTRSLEQAAYYRVSPRDRMLVAAVYIGLIVLLAFGMHESHILASGSHSFRSL